jgi:hypothetical protein
MNAGRAINRYLDALTYARAALDTPGILVPFALFCALQLVVVLVMAFFATPVLAPIMVPVMQFLGGEQSLHYPMHLVGLPSVYHRVYLPLVATAGFLLWCLAVWKLVERHPIGAERARRDFRPAVRHILVIGVLFVGASVATGELAARLLGPKTPEIVERVVLFASVGVTAVLQSFLVYAPLVLRLRGGNVRSAIATGGLRAPPVRRHRASDRHRAPRAPAG